MIACYSHCVYLTPSNDCIFQGHFLHAPNFEMATILKEKGFDVLSGQKLCRQCVTDYEKLTKPP